MLVAFFSWWYGRGWKQVVDGFAPRLRKIAAGFSVGQLLPTLFAPWRRIITEPGRSFQERWRAWADNTFSRVIGFFVRIFVLLAAGLILLVMAILGVIEIIIWPLLPLLIPLCIIVGIVA